MNPEAFDAWWVARVVRDTSAPAIARKVRKARATAIDTIVGVVPDTIEISRRGALGVIEAIRARDGERAIAEHALTQKECLDRLMKVLRDR